MIKVLIPGVPIQNNWKDQTNPGVWILDFEPGHGVGHSQHISIYDFRDDGTYHQFLNGETYEGICSTPIRTLAYIGNKRPVKSKSKAQEVSSDLVTNFSDTLFETLRKSVEGEEGLWTA